MMSSVHAGTQRNVKKLDEGTPVSRDYQVSLKEKVADLVRESLNDQFLNTVTAVMPLV